MKNYKLVTCSFVILLFLPIVCSVSIIELKTNANPKLNKGDVLKITLNYEATCPAQIYFCKTENIFMTGCKDEILQEFRNVYENPVVANYQTSSSDSDVLRFWVMICDFRYDCYTSDPFDVLLNNLPVIESIKILPLNDTNFSNTTNIKCEVNVSDIDNDNISIHYEWYRNKVKIFEDIDRNILSHLMTERNDKISCRATAFDGLGYSTPKESESVQIEPYSDFPKIIFFDDHSTPNQPSDLKEGVIFDMEWEDIDSNVFNIYVCDYQGVLPSGCLGKSYATLINYYDSHYLIKKTQLKYQPLYEHNASYYATICDDSNKCSEILSGSFYIFNFSKNNTDTNNNSNSENNESTVPEENNEENETISVNDTESNNTAYNNTNESEDNNSENSNSTDTNSNNTNQTNSATRSGSSGGSNALLEKGFEKEEYMNKFIAKTEDNKSQAQPKEAEESEYSEKGRDMASPARVEMEKKENLVTGMLIKDSQKKYSLKLIGAITSLVLLTITLLFWGRSERQLRTKRERQEEIRKAQEEFVLKDLPRVYPKPFTAAQKYKSNSYILAIKNKNLLQRYIYESLKLKRNEEKLRKELETLGWPYYLVNETIEVCKRIIRQETLGELKEKIRR